MNFLTRFSLKNGAVIFMAIILILAGGWYSVKGMKSEALPDIDAPFIWMSVVYPGATPHDVSKEITDPLGKSLQGLGGVKSLTTQAYQNYGVVLMEFDYSVDLDKAVQDVNNAVQKVDLPKEAQKSTVHKANVNNPDIISFAVSGPGTQEEIANHIDQVVKPKLVNIPGVEAVNISGVAAKKVFIKLDPDQMLDNQVSPEQVKQALQYANLSIPAGQVTMDDKLVPIEVKKETTTLEDIRKIRLVSVDSSKLIQDAFGSVGSGFSQMAGALGQIGAGMEQGFASVGQMQVLTQTQIRLLGGIQSLMLLISQDQTQFQVLQGQGAPPDQLEGLKMKIEAEQAQLQELMNQINQVNDQVASMGGQQKSGQKSDPKQWSGKQAVALDGQPSVKVITLGDVADVSYGYEKKTMYTRTNGSPGVTFALTRQGDANVVEVSDQARDVINSLQLPKDYHIDVLYDLADPIKKSVSSMVKESLLGALFAVLVIFIFLGNFRATIVAITAIPLSVFASFIILKQLGYTMNIMTLSGMAVAVGRVVDDSIVVIENIFRRLSGERGGTAMVREATGEVASAITSSTITTVAVFAPLAMVTGIVGKVFTPFAVTVVVALLFSLLVAVTVVPLMARLLLTRSSIEEKGSGTVKELYGRILLWSLNHKMAVIIIALVTLAGSFFMATRIGTNFLPQDKVRIYQARVAMPVGTSLEKTDQLAREVEKILKSEEGIKTYQTTVTNDASASIFIVFKDEVEDTKALSDDIRDRFKKVKGAQDISLQEVGGPGGNPVLQVVVNGNDFDSIKEGGQAITEAVRTVPGLANVTSSIEEVRPQVEIAVNEEAAAGKGLSPVMVAGTIRAMISGDTAGSVELDGKTADIIISLAGGDVPDLEAIKKLELTSMTGEKVTVKDVAKVSMKPGPTSIQIRNGQPFLIVQGLITDTNSGKVGEDVKATLKDIELPEGVTYSFEGNTEMMSQGFSDMAVAMMVAILLVFIVMVAAFGNIRAPLAILVSLPMAVIGSLLGLFLTGEELGMPALVGGLMLIGIVVTNAIVLVDRVQKQTQSGVTTDEALVEAGKTRLRPIIMTAVTTIMALVPLAVTPAEGALISRSMAVVVIGGLTTSTVLTLIVVPVVYKVLDNIVSSYRYRRPNLEEENGF